MKLNVGKTERWISMGAGLALLAYGVSRRSESGATLGAVGTGLALRGLTGFCPIYDTARHSTAGEGSPNASIPYERGVRVERAITINRPPAEIFAFWRKLENLPRFMDHLESVTTTDGKRSHWVAKAPFGSTVEWDAEIIHEEAGHLIGWQSVADSQIPNAGSVHFDPDPHGRGTLLKIELRYDPPGGRLGSMVAKLFGEEPEIQVASDLLRLKQILELGDVVST